MTTKVNKENLEKLKLIQDQLQHGDLKKIASIVGLSAQTIQNHISGRVINPSTYIIDVAIEVIREKKKSLKRLNRKIEKSIS